MYTPIQVMLLYLVCAFCLDYVPPRCQCFSRQVAGLRFVHTLTTESDLHSSEHRHSEAVHLMLTKP